MWGIILGSKTEQLALACHTPEEETDSPNEFYLCQLKCQHLSYLLQHSQGTFHPRIGIQNEIREFYPVNSIEDMGRGNERLHSSDKTFPCKKQILSINRNN